MDIATVVGFALTITLFLMAMLDGGTIDTFVNVPSLLIVVGGTLGAHSNQFSVARRDQVIEIFCLRVRTAQAKGR